LTRPEERTDPLPPVTEIRRESDLPVTFPFPDIRKISLLAMYSSFDWRGQPNYARAISEASISEASIEEVLQAGSKAMRSNGDVMKLKIIWRNLYPPGAAKLVVKQILADAYGALYEVRSAHDVKVFELLGRHAA
jgi:hypothetical protein